MINEFEFLTIDDFDANDNDDIINLFASYKVKDFVEENLYFAISNLEDEILNSLDDEIVARLFYMYDYVEGYET